MVTIEWTSGARDSAPTWDALLDLMRGKQAGGMTEKQYRYAMYLRAARWSGKKIDRHALASMFFADLEWAKLIIIRSYREEI